MKTGDLVRNKNTREVGIVIKEADRYEWPLILYANGEVTSQIESLVEVISESR